MNLKKLKKRAKELKKHIGLLYLAYKHPKTPWYAKILTILTIAYALSPIDLIPDFIPILGYLDDLIIIPAGIALTIKLIPKEVIDECREKEEDFKSIKRKGIYAAVIITLLWIWILYIILRVLGIV